MEDLTSEALWEKYKASQGDSEKIWRKNRTFASDVWFRFRHNKAALLGFILILLLLFFAIAGPYISPHSYFDQELGFVNIPPKFNAFSVEDKHIYITQNLKLVEISNKGELLRTLPRIDDNPAEKSTTYNLNGKTLILDYSKKPVRLLNSDKERYKTYTTFYNKNYILGTDGLGRDILTRLMYGARISLTVAFIAALVNLFIGIIYGGISAYMGGNVDNIMMRIVDIISTIPLTLYVILIMVFLNSGFLSIIIALGSVYWVNMARIVRGQILSLKEQEFVYAAKTIGTSTWNILIKHLVPNAMGPIIVTATMLIPSAIFIEAFMSFIGLGVAAPMASWGTMCNDALETLRTSPYQLLTPSLAICLTMFAFNFVGDGLRDALDPKLRK